MFSDGFTFLKRAQLFFSELKANKYPNAVTLARNAKCSKNTAQRTIYRLRDEQCVPIKYDSVRKGYYLSDPDFLLPSIIPPGKDELTALLLACDLIKTIDAPDLHSALDSLWTQYASTNPIINRDLTPLTNVFSSSSTAVSIIADTGLFSFLEAARAGESVRILYKSPWRHSDPKTYEGRIERVHYSDGALYLLFLEKSGRHITLNSSFVKELVVLDYTVNIENVDDANMIMENWLAGFGIWSGENIQQITVEILPPASRYYASQSWHEDQEDMWDGDVLIRQFPAIVSPEVVRRMLSLGSWIRSIRPEDLRKAVVEHASSLVKALSLEGEIPDPRSEVGV